MGRFHRHDDGTVHSHDHDEHAHEHAHGDHGHDQCQRRPAALASGAAAIGPQKTMTAFAKLRVKTV